MSFTLLRYIPADPHWQPTPEAAARAVSLLETMALKADEIKSRFEDKVRFFDPGENWSGVECYACGADASGWWGRAMDAAYAAGFRDLETPAPCCGKTVSLNELRYGLPAAFGRFALEVRNPETADPTEEQDRAVGEYVGMPVRKVWAHY
ncbi:hypothetical protein [Rhizobium sp. BK379]|uniref:hypothetical protein n=1 Tax=Rhizobium sp. BK379 TaxID=2587059 RepID=UPI00160B758D|nr:hypothetical protein [Rhizobium sp. BK379]MBB3440948.1 hypothetical protein [Rhizobium sp. BK379]